LVRLSYEVHTYCVNTALSHLMMKQVFHTVTLSSRKGYSFFTAEIRANAPKSYRIIRITHARTHTHTHLNEYVFHSFFHSSFCSSLLSLTIYECSEQTAAIAMWRCWVCSCR